jgi:DNA-binding NtrC family response regulator
MLATATFAIDALEAPVVQRPALAGRQQRVRRASKRSATGSVCLVVSPDPLRRMMFGQAAERAGWRSVVCEDQAQAMEHIAAGAVGLTLVDTATSTQSAADRKSLVESLAGRHNLLTVVCGRTNDTQEEIWAREQAAWMYLPGVAPESDIDPILSAAKEVVEKLNKASRSLVGVANEF